MTHAVKLTLAELESDTLELLLAEPDGDTVCSGDVACTSAKSTRSRPAAEVGRHMSSERRRERERSTGDSRCVTFVSLPLE